MTEVSAIPAPAPVAGGGALVKSPRLAVAICVHHKPWLAMGTLITLALQSFHDFDVHIVYIVGDGECPDRPSYEPYRRFALGVETRQRLDPAADRLSYEGYDRAARDLGINPKLSPFDERVREVCRLRGVAVSEVEVENDHALDSGAWYRFIRSGVWQSYDYVLCIQEGTLFSRPNVLAAALRLATESNVHFLAGGHYKSRAPKCLFLDNYNTRESNVRPLDRFHNEMIRVVFDRFCRDREFRQLIERWPDEGAAIQQAHVPDLWRNRAYWRIRHVAEARGELPRAWFKWRAARWLRSHRDLFPREDLRRAQWRVALASLFGGPPNGQKGRADDCIHVNGERRPVDTVVPYVEVEGVRFHREPAPEWCGCACNHLFSGTFIYQLAARLEEQELYSVLDLPFAGSALEVIWGFFPQWLGFEKWFFDGLHRVTKNFVTYRREDEPMIMASYINRYYPGMVAVDWSEEFLTVRALHPVVRDRVRLMLASDCFWRSS